MFDDVIPHGRHTCPWPLGLSWLTGFVSGLWLVGWADLIPSIACCCGSPAGCRIKHAGREVEQQRANSILCRHLFPSRPQPCLCVYVCVCLSVWPHSELECVSVSVCVLVWEEIVKLFLALTMSSMTPPNWLVGTHAHAHTDTQFREVNPKFKDYTLIFK